MSKGNTLNRSPVHLLHRASQSVAELFSREVKSDLTPRQLAVLSAIARNEGCSQTDIVEQTGVDRSTMAELVRRLVDKGLVERRRSKKDTRAYVIKLSQDGQRILKGAEPLAKRVDDKVLHALGGRSATFLDSLSVLARRLESASKT